MSWLSHEARFLCYEQVALGEAELRDELLLAWTGADAILLGHAADGLIWGRLLARRPGEQGAAALELAADRLDAAGLQLHPWEARLRRETLRELRLFDGEQELRLWRQGALLQACRVREVAAVSGEEAGTVQSFAAWGDCGYELLRQPEGRPAPGTFAELCGLAGQRHSPPGVTVGQAPAGVQVRLGTRPAQKLLVRHYLQLEEPSRLLRETEHRLLALQAGEEAR